MVVIIRARADQAHVSAQHIDDLRQFVDARLAQEPAQRRDAVLFQGRIGMAFDFIDGTHRAELEGGERLAVASHALLKEEQTARVFDRVHHEQRQRAEQQNRQQQNADQNLNRHVLLARFT